MEEYNVYHTKCILPTYFYKYNLINFKNDFINLTKNDDIIIISIKWKRKESNMFIVLKSKMEWDAVHNELIKLFLSKSKDKYQWFLLKSYQSILSDKKNENLLLILENNIDDNIEDDNFSKNEKKVKSMKKLKNKKYDTPDDIDELSDSDIESLNNQINQEILNIFKKRTQNTKYQKRSKKIIKKH